MISRIEAVNFRCLRHVNQNLRPFQILVGPNGSGKSTFLDAIAFQRDFVLSGVRLAASKRTDNFIDLVWGKRGGDVQLVTEFDVDTTCARVMVGAGFRYRYETKFDFDPERNFVRVSQETGTLINDETHTEIVSFTRSNGIVQFYSDMAKQGVGPSPIEFRLGEDKSALGYLPDDGERFPVSLAIRESISDAKDLKELSPNVLKMRKSSEDFSAFPLKVKELAGSHPNRFRNWIIHLQSVIRDLQNVDTEVREEDRHRYVTIKYRSSQHEIELPSWSVSDGTLRLLTLTLPAYLVDFQQILMVEEPENGLHPLAIEAVHQSLSSIYDGQVFVATHSPLFVALTKPEEVLAFNNDEDGAVHIIAGNEHPDLADWNGETDLGTLFASGVLG